MQIGRRLAQWDAASGSRFCQIKWIALKNTLASALSPIVLPVFSVFVLFFGASCRPFFPREVSSAVLAIEGSAAGTFAGQTTRLTPNEWLLPGTKIATAPGSRLDLMLLPGILVELAGATEIEITRLRFARDGDETLRPMQAREASLRLLRGTLVVAIGQSQMRSRIFIESPAGDLTAFDLRTFKIRLDGEQRAGHVRAGQSQFQTGGRCRPGHDRARLFCRMAPTDREPRAAAESDFNIQAEVPEILQRGKAAFSSSENFGFGFSPWVREWQPKASQELS